MSEIEPISFIEAAGPDEANAVARRLIEAGRAEPLAERVLDALGSEAAWRREHVLDLLRALEPVGEVLVHLLAALADPARADRRNAARSALAALGAPGAPHARPTVQALADRLARDADADVRLLAATALGESGNPAARPALEAALSDRDPNVAAAAADALGVLGLPEALDALQRVLEGDALWVRSAAVVALGRIGDPAALPALRRCLHDPWLARGVVDAVREIGDARGLELLGDAARTGAQRLRAQALRAAGTVLTRNPEQEPPAWVREVAREQREPLEQRFRAEADPCDARLLGATATPEAADALLQALGDPELRDAAAVGLGALPAALARAALLPRLADAGPDDQTLLLGLLPALQAPDEIRTVAQMLGSERPETRAEAAELLSRSDEPAVLSALLPLLERAEMRLGATQALGRLGSARCAPLLTLLEDDDPEIRRAAAYGAARCGLTTPAVLRSALERESDADVQRALLGALGTTGGAEAATWLAPWARSDDAATRFAAIRALGCTGSAAAYEPLLGALADPAPEIQAAAMQALGELGDVRAAEPVAERVLGAERDLRRVAAFALHRLAPRGAVDRLVEALGDPDREVRTAAARTLGLVGGERAHDALRGALDHESDPLVRRAIRTALEPGGASAGPA